MLAQIVRKVNFLLRFPYFVVRLAMPIVLIIILKLYIFESTNYVVGRTYEMVLPDMDIAF